MDPAPRPERGVEPVASTERREPLVVAHRGTWSAAPQNSLAALEGAIALGCDMVELDVRRTRDGRLVAVHDPRIQGTKVRTLDHAQLKARLGPKQAPSLAEVLERAGGRIRLDIELKEDGYVEQVTVAVAKHLAPEGYVVTSFSALSWPRSSGRPPRSAPGCCCAPPARSGWSAVCSAAALTSSPPTRVWPAPVPWPGLTSAAFSPMCGRSITGACCTPCSMTAGWPR